MVEHRTWKAALLLAATVLALAGLWAWAGAGPAEEGAAEVGLVVVEPDGNRLHDGAVVAGNGTVLGALDAAAEAAGFPYETETYAMGVQVVSINGTHNEGSSGWVYRVRSDGTWCWGDRASDRKAVEEGDRVRWEWSEEPPSGGCREAEGGGS